MTLHVGAGTFQPVRGDDIDTHIMHAEVVEVERAGLRGDRAHARAGRAGDCGRHDRGAQSRVRGQYW